MRNIFRRKSKLNERQLEILQSKNMPTTWKALNLTQKEAIVAIDEMLSYLEKKYKKKFFYNGYVPENKLFLDEEYLVAYAEGDDPETDSFTVERKGMFGYKDSYAWVTQSPIVQKEMEDKLSGIFEGQKYKMFVELTGVSDEGIVEYFDIYIYIDNADSKITDELMEKTISAFSDESRDYDVLMYCFKNPVVDNITKKEHNRCIDAKDLKYIYNSTPTCRNEKHLKWRRDDR